MHDLANFRYVLRQFLRFSEEAATRVGLPSQQHQLLLQIAGIADGEQATLAYLVQRLAVRHHTLVELSQRCEEAGLLVRKSDPRNRRIVVLKLTAAGNRLLQELSDDHVRELEELGPNLIAALQKVTVKNDTL